MTKVSLRTLDSVTNNDTTATALINENFRNVQAAIENTLSRDGSVPNYMDANFDLNSKRIINLGDPVDDHDAITKKYFTDTIGDAASYATAAAISANSAASSAQSSAVSAAQAIAELQQAEATINAAVQQAVNTASGQAAADIANYVNTVVEPNLQSIANMSQGYSNNSSNYANLAMAWASQPSGTVDGSEYSAKYYAGISKDWTNVAHNYSNSSSGYSNNSSNYANSSLEYANNSSNYANSSLGYANSSSNYANNASIWAEGTDVEVSALGGQHSAKGWANVASSLTAVDLTSTQTITGTKTIEKNTVNPTPHLILKNTAMETTYGQTSTGDVAEIAVQDTGGTERGAFFTYQGNDYTACGIRTKANDTYWKEFEIRTYNDGKVVASAGTDVKRSILEWAFPETAVTNLTLGSSGAEYTASDTGYVSIDKRAGAAAQYVQIASSSSGAPRNLQGSYTGYTSGCECWAWLFVNKGEKFKVIYTTSGNTEWFRFIKAKGVA